MKPYKRLDRSNDPLPANLGIATDLKFKKRNAMYPRMQQTGHLAKNCKGPWCEIKAEWLQNLKDIAKKMRIAAKVPIKYEKVTAAEPAKND